MKLRYFALAASAALVSLSVSAQNAQEAAAAAAAALQNAPETQQVVKPNYWTQSLMTNINYGQTSLTNWAAGGDNTTTLAAYIDGNANFKKDVKVNGKSKDMYWNNRLQLDYGFLYASSKPILQKNTDRMYLESKWGYEIEKKLYFSANFDFKSQFSTGYKYNTPSTSLEGLSKGDIKQQWLDARSPLSGFLAPAYTNIALGIDWKPNNWFSLSVAPATGGLVIVKDPQYRQSYSMKLKSEYENAQKGDAAFDSGEAFRPVRFELGAQVKADLKAQVNDNLKYTTQLVLFSNYLNKPQNVRVNWDNRLDWKLAKFFSATLITNLIYDDLVKIKDAKTGELRRAGIQFKESFALGFTYTFAKKK